MEKQCGGNPCLNSSSSIGRTDRSNSQNGTQEHQPQKQQQHVGGGESSSASIDDHPSSAVDILASIDRSSTTVDNSNSATPKKRNSWMMGGKELKSSTCQPVNGEKKESPTTLGNNNKNKLRMKSILSTFVFRNLDGFVGWMGLGGSIFQWHPELEVKTLYLCSDKH